MGSDDEPGAERDDWANAPLEEWDEAPPDGGERAEKRDSPDDGASTNEWDESGEDEDEWLDERSEPDDGDDWAISDDDWRSEQATPRAPEPTSDEAERPSTSDTEPTSAEAERPSTSDTEPTSAEAELPPTPAAPRRDRPDWQTPPPTTGRRRSGMNSPGRRLLYESEDKLPTAPRSTPRASRSTPWWILVIGILLLLLGLVVVASFVLSGDDEVSVPAAMDFRTTTTATPPTTSDTLDQIETTTTTSSPFSPSPPAPVSYLGVGLRFIDGQQVTAAGHSVSSRPSYDRPTTWTFGCNQADWLTPFPSTHPSIEVATCGFELVAFDTRDGTQLWRRTRRSDSDRSRIGTEVLVMQRDNGSVQVLDLLTGEDRFVLDDIGPANVATAEDAVYLGTDRGVHAHDATSGERRWTAPVPTSGLYATADAVFARSSAHRLHRLDPATGEPVAASERAPDRLAWSDVIGVNPSVVVLKSTTTGVVSVHDRQTAQFLWSYAPPDGAVGIGIGDRFIALLDWDATLHVHDARSGELVYETAWEPGGSGVDGVGKAWGLGLDPWARHLVSGWEAENS